MSCFDLGGWLMCQSLRLTVFLWSSLSFAFEDIINQRTYTSIMGQAAESLNLALSGYFSCQANEKVSQVPNLHFLKKKESQDCLCFWRKFGRVFPETLMSCHRFLMRVNKW